MLIACFRVLTQQAHEHIEMQGYNIVHFILGPEYQPLDVGISHPCCTPKACRQLYLNLSTSILLLHNTWVLKCEISDNCHCSNLWG